MILIQFWAAKTPIWTPHIKKWPKNTKVTDGQPLEKDLEAGVSHLTYLSHYATFKILFQGLAISKRIEKNLRKHESSVRPQKLNS